MRLPLAVTTILIAALASASAYGQAPLGNPAKPIGAPPTKLGSPPPTDALSNLAGGGYADPNYVPPGSPRNTTRHHTTRHRMNNVKGYAFLGYRSYKAFPCQHWYCYCDFPIFP
jgi:hypothetical protein